MDDQRKPRSSRRRKIALADSVICCVAVSGCYWFQPDWLAAVTLVPAWCWLVPALVLTGFGFSRTHKRRCIAAAILWVVFTAIFVEEVRSLIHLGNQPTSDWMAARERGRAIHVVSLNCNVANPQSAAEIADFEPDIVLLQESPSREHLQHLARKLFGPDGTFLWGGDTSILAGGQIQAGRLDTSSHFVHATVELPTGIKVDVISVRLNPPVFRLVFWSHGFWTDHRNNRVKHRRQILDVMETVQGIPQSAQLIVGGDFNAPPRDAALIPLRQRLFDTFTEAGRGWGNTGMNDYPFFRVDQIWASRDFRAESVTAHKTIHSDHRMIVCDLVLQQ
jgi:endonuclease/exonuclease/phosphatase (EEP) superfamily protein YafD